MADGMKLDEFAAETLAAVLRGMAEAQNLAAELGAFVNPVGLRAGTQNTSSDYYLDARWDPGKDQLGLLGQNIEFDVALTTTTREGSEGGAGVFVSSIMAGMKGYEGAENVQASRVKFKVPTFVILRPKM